MRREQPAGRARPGACGLRTRSGAARDVPQARRGAARTGDPGPDRHDQSDGEQDGALRRGGRRRGCRTPPGRARARRRTPPHPGRATARPPAARRAGPSPPRSRSFGPGTMPWRREGARKMAPANARSARSGRTMASRSSSRDRPRADSMPLASPSTICGSASLPRRGERSSPLRSSTASTGPIRGPRSTTRRSPATWSRARPSSPVSSPVSSRTALACVRRLMPVQRSANSGERTKRSTRSRTKRSSAEAIGRASGAARGGSSSRAASSVRSGVRDHGGHAIDHDGLDRRVDGQRRDGAHVPVGVGDLVARPDADRGEQREERGQRQQQPVRDGAPAPPARAGELRPQRGVLLAQPLGLGCGLLVVHRA